jgi:hypothetical protein
LVTENLRPLINKLNLTCVSFTLLTPSQSSLYAGDASAEALVSSEQQLIWLGQTKAAIFEKNKT